MPNRPKQSLLEVDNLTVEFKSGEAAKHRALDSVSLSLSEGEILGIVGESGSGKTVLSHAILGLLPRNGSIKGGSITWGGQTIHNLNDRDYRQIRGNEIAMIFQDAQASLNPVYPVGKQLEWVLKLHRGMSPSDAKKKTLDLFDSVKLRDPNRVAMSYPNELSGGMCQRIMIAIALAGHPKLLIADEPTSALDVTIQAEIAELLIQVQREMNLSMLFVTHDLGLASNLCDNILVMNQGQVIEKDITRNIFKNPSHEYTKRLIRSLMTPSQLSEKSNQHSALNN